MTDANARPTDASLHARARRSLARSRRLTGLSMRLERIWPLVAPLAWVLVAFLALAWFGVFRASPDWLRVVLVALFVPLIGLAAWRAVRYEAPSAAEIDRRLERANGLQHAPVSVQADALPDTADPAARALWAEHRRRMSERLRQIGRASCRER